MARLSRSCLLLLPALACTRPNPAFNDFASGTDDTGEDTRPGDGDPSTGDGDGDPGDGDGDPGDGDGDPGDGDGDPGDGDGDGDGDPNDCDADQVMCDGACVDLATNPQNCGGCGNDCTPELLCSDSQCAPAKHVFVTSSRFPGNIGGIAMADNFCGDIASLANRTGTYKAWVSNGEQWPDDLFSKAPAVYVRFDDAVVAYSFADLVDGTLVHPINITEGGVLTEPSPACDGAVEHAVWTGTDPFGKGAFATCTGWTGDNAATGLVGDAMATDMTWTASGCQAACTATLPLYCIEQ